MKIKPDSDRTPIMSRRTKKSCDQTIKQMNHLKKSSMQTDGKSDPIMNNSDDDVNVREQGCG